ncbi:MAG: DUF6088 family protein [Ignavibacteria bacterium]|nr:DUF6088 family protein [Ignavibacteria bacterium]
MQNTEKQILRKIKKAKRGALFFVESFQNIGNLKTVSKTLERLTKKGEISRVAAGIYNRPIIDPIIGKVTPGIDEIAKAIAKRDRARIVPTGVYALNKLGLSTQVPMNVVFFTDGSARKVKINKRTINFKKTTPKNVLAAGEISRLAIQALRSIGEKNVTEEQIKKIQTLLEKEKKTKLEHDIRLAPVWIKKIFKPVLENK